jgi:hypothetical protein
MMKRVLTTSLAFGFAVLIAATAHAVNWGTGFNDFRNTCGTLDGVLSGTGSGATCAYGGEVENVPAGSPGWTVDVATSTVATWKNAKTITEVHGNRVVVACYNPGGQEMNLSHQHCVPE